MWAQGVLMLNHGVARKSCFISLPPGISHSPTDLGRQILAGWISASAQPPADLIFGERAVEIRSNALLILVSGPTRQTGSWRLGAWPQTAHKPTQEGLPPQVLQHLEYLSVLQHLEFLSLGARGQGQSPSRRTRCLPPSLRGSGRPSVAQGGHSA